MAGDGVDWWGKSEATMKMVEELEGEFYFEKDEGGRFWWVRFDDRIGMLAFTFDRKKIYYYFSGDYPDRLTAEERRIFEEDCPFWAKSKG